MSYRFAYRTKTQNWTTAFTLLEILLVVAAIAILATIVIVAINPQKQLAQLRDTQRQSHLNTLNSALTQYVIEGNTLPSTIVDNSTEICDTGNNGQGHSIDCTDAVDLSFLVPTHISAIPTDPLVNSTAFLDFSVHAQVINGSGYFIELGDSQRLFFSAPKSEQTYISVGISKNKFALEFNGTDGYVSIPDHTLINTNSGSYNKKTNELWFYARDITSRQMLWEQGGSSNGLNIYIENGQVHIGGWTYSTPPSWEHYISSSIEINTWYHVASVLDTKGNFTGYLNGEVIGEEQMGSETLFTHTGNIGIGAVSDGTRYPAENFFGDGDYFNGYIDEVRHWNETARTEEQIKKSMNVNLTGTEDGLAAYWKFKEGMNSVVGDNTNNAINGSIVGGVSWSETVPY